MLLGLYFQCRTCKLKFICESAKEKFDPDFKELECIDYKPA